MIPLFKVAVDVEAALSSLRHTLESGYLGEGPKCAALETQLANVLGMRVLLVNSGTSALRLALHLAGARRGTEVVSTPVTCLATNSAIMETGARIVWADVDPATGNIDPADAARKVSSKTATVMAVDWSGRLCDFAELRNRVRGLSIVEDAAHAFGATRGPSQRGDYIAYSYQAIKHFTMGDGGGLVCPGDAQYERARLLRWFGLDRTRGDSMRVYQSVAEAGFKMQSNDVAASVGLASLKGAMSRVRANATNAATIDAQLADVPYVTRNPLNYGSSYWFYGLKVSSPLAFERFMASCCIAAGQVHSRNDTNPCFDGSKRSELPGVEEFCAHQVNVPCGWWLTDAELVSIVAAVREWSRQPEARW